MMWACPEQVRRRAVRLLPFQSQGEAEASIIVVVRDESSDAISGYVRTFWH